MKLRKLFRVLGCVLILASLGLGAFSLIRTNQAKERCADAVQRIQALLPSPTAGIMDQYSSMAMPVLEVGGQDYVCLIRIPVFGVTLPVKNGWNQTAVSLGPCRFSGTVYDGSLIIGGADQTGQFDFFDRLDLDDKITVTDMTGAEFHYAVTRIDRAKSADAEALNRHEADLVLFVRDALSMEYLIVRCNSAS